MDPNYCVYILTNRRNGTLYTGITSRLAERVDEHKQGVVGGFTRKYELDKLVWYERHDSAEAAITREKQIKEWRRRWKIELIEEINPYWNDLSSDVV